MYGVPNKVRRRRKVNKNGIAKKQDHSSDCSCCWADIEVQ